MTEMLLEISLATVAAEESLTWKWNISYIAKSREQFYSLELLVCFPVDPAYQFHLYLF